MTKYWSQSLPISPCNWSLFIQIHLVDVKEWNYQVISWPLLSSWISFLLGKNGTQNDVMFDSVIVRNKKPLFDWFACFYQDVAILMISWKFWIDMRGSLLSCSPNFLCDRFWWYGLYLNGRGSWVRVKMNSKESLTPNITIVLAMQMVTGDSCFGTMAFTPW